ncbi:hypothetical protein INT45_003505, partial [Circinella minor]
EEICEVENQMAEQGIPQGSMQAVDSATQALQGVNNLHAELNSQLPVEMKKIYDAQGKMEGQVNTLTSSLQSIMAQLQQISNHQDKVVQAISDDSRTVGKSSYDENSLDINAESSHNSLDENSSDDDDKKDSHHCSHGQFRFKVPDEKSRLESLCQTSSVTKYNSTFQAAFVECTNVSEAEALSRYISGLKSQTKKYVELEELRVLRKAMKLAENYDNASFGSYHSSSSHHKSHNRDSSNKRNKRHHHSRHSRDRGSKQEKKAVTNAVEQRNILRRSVLCVESSQKTNIVSAQQVARSY